MSSPAAPDRATIRYAYLGPESTFTEMALNAYLDGGRAGTAEPVPQADVVAAIEAVRTGTVDYAVVPMENSVEGGVTATLDTLAEGDHLRIVGEVVVPVTFVLAVRPDSVSTDEPVWSPDDPGAPLPRIGSVGTHTHAHAQCRRWLAAHLPGATALPASSTAGAAAMLAAGEAAYDAAICAPIAAERYGLTIVAERIEDNPHGATRFVVVGRNDAATEPTGADKTTLVVFLPHNQPGALLEMLEQFVARGVNLSRIESRPVGDALGRYSFSLDVEGHIDEERMQEVLMGLHRMCPTVRFLGSYPRADRVAPVIRAGTADADFRSARSWVDGLLQARAD